MIGDEDDFALAPDAPVHVDRAGGKDDPPLAFIKRDQVTPIIDALLLMAVSVGGRFATSSSANLLQTNDELLWRQHALPPHATLATFSGPACSMARM
jgi:hypothetical protein